MPVRLRWHEVLSAPAFLINLDSRPDRLALSTAEIERAGFSDIRHFSAVDARDPDVLQRAWAACDAPSFAGWDVGFDLVPGKQGCFLSHLAVWQVIVEQDLPFACIFEDDVVFHRHWSQLAPTAFAFTPRDYNLLFMRNMIVTPGAGLVRQTPVLCTHAYVITREGAQRLRPLLLHHPEGVGSIDIMLFRHQLRWEADPRSSPFTWYAWNGTTFADKRASVEVEWENRNTGLVFQDFTLGSDIAATMSVT